MKKLLLAFFVVTLSTSAFAQTSFDAKIKENNAKLEKAKTLDEFDNLFTTFSALIPSGDSNNKWKAFYYSAFAQYKKADLLIKSNETASATNANAIAYKYLLGGVSNTKTEYKKLLELLDKQKIALSK